MLKHWQDLELGKAVREAGEDGLGDQQDDDPQDAHTGVTDGMDEAESIHSWGNTIRTYTATHVALVAQMKQGAATHGVTAYSFSLHVSLLAACQQLVLCTINVHVLTPLLLPCADQLHGERLLASRYLQDQPSGIQSSQQIPLHTSVSIQDMGAMPSPALSQNSTAGESCRVLE